MLKFTVVLSLAMFLTVLVLGIFIYFRLKTELFEDIKREGALGVTMLSLLGQEILEGRKLQADVLESVGPQSNFWVREPAGEAEKLPVSVLKKMEEIQKMVEDTEEKGKGLFSSLLNYSGSLPRDYSEVLDAVVTKRTYTDEKEYMILGARSASFTFRGAERDKKPLELMTQKGPLMLKDITILEGEYEPKEGTRVGAFEFLKAIQSSENKRIGMARLTLSAQRVTEITGRMRGFLILSSGAALILGFVFSFVLASLVNRPLELFMEDIQIVAKEGRLDHRARIRTNDEVGLLARTFNQMTESLKEAHKAEIENETLRRDLEVGKDIQTNLVPQEMPQIPGLDISARYEPARHVGGDAFDLVPLSEGRLGAVIADVAGKGVAGALYMAMTRIAFRVATKQSRSPRDIVATVHQLMSPELADGRFITAVYMEVDPQAGKVSCCRLGHNPILHFSASSGQVYSYAPRGTAIGIVPTDRFRQILEVCDFAVQPGDQVLVYTDGISEAADPEEQEYGQERIVQFLQQNAKLTPDQLVQALIQDVKTFTRGLPMADDLTVVSISLTGQPATAVAGAQPVLQA
ncbi:MAG: SpoIIE family protein phosphatase [Planctomycetes bacterium]|nr:SpoIIE family protein phosphatase [Planctomycetota bacterium]